MNKILKVLIITVILFQTSILSANSQEKIKIDIVSDIVCPWCAIGFKRLNTAIDELGLQDRVEIVWHPFELNPNMPKEGQNADRYLMNKLGIDKNQLTEKRKSVTQTGKESGFKFDYFKEMRKLNTFDSHVLLEYAKKFNKQTQLNVRLQEAYFSERKNISNREVLYDEVKSVGLNPDEAIKELDNQETIKKVKEEEKYWREEQGVFAIPTIYFNNSIRMVGANQVDVYKQILSHLTNQ
jgi:predicted DsbA family dithiol-disulfide isomerase